MTVTTNVPGPRERLYILGRPIREILPYVPIGTRMRTGIAVLTCHSQAVFGVTADYDAVPEIAVFTDTIMGELRALRRAAEKRSAGATR